MVTLLSWALSPQAAHAQLGGQEIWFDGPEGVQPGTDRSRPHVGVGGGTSVVVFQANTDSQDIYRRRFDLVGGALESPILVNTTAATTQTAPRVAVASDGSHLVVWIHEIDDGGSVFSIRSRHYGADGTPTRPSEDVVDADPTFSGGALRPDVTSLAVPGCELPPDPVDPVACYVAVWRSATSSGSDTGISLQARLFDSLGVPLGDQFQVNVETAGNQDYPAVDGLPADDPDGSWDGGFVVTWVRPATHLRRFRSDGTTGEGQLEIYDEVGDELEVAASENGSVAVVWQDMETVRVGLFDDSLSAVAPPLAVASLDTSPNGVSVASVGGDGYLISWDNTEDSGPDTSGFSVQGRMLDPNGTFDGAQFLINDWTQNNQRDAAMDSAQGTVGIAWRSNGVSDVIPGNDHILGYLLSYCELFCDDFESADTSQWSSQIP